MAARSQRYTQLLSSHPYHSSISSSPSFALDATDGGNHGTGAAAAASHRPQDDGLGALASPRLTELPRGAVCASDCFFVSPARTASLVDAGEGAGEALWGALLVETYSSDPRAEFSESMAEMVAACGAEGMPAPEYREFMEQLLACYLERNDRGRSRARPRGLCRPHRAPPADEEEEAAPGADEDKSVRLRHMMLSLRE